MGCTERLPVAAPAGAALFGHFQVGELAVGGLHELLQAGLEVCRAGGLGSCGTGLAGLAGGMVLMVGVVAAAEIAVTAPEVGPALPLPGETLGTGRRGRGFLMDRLIRPASSMLTTFTLTAWPSERKSLTFST